MAQAYRNADVQVYYLDPGEPVTPNSIFCADLFFMTPQGAILARPASTVRAGEERLVARRLAALDVPILMSVHGDGVFEGADAMWIDEGTAIFKCTNNPPVGASKFLTYEGLPTDHYLWLVGQGGRLLRGEIQPSDEMPARRPPAAKP